MRVRNRASGSVRTPHAGSLSGDEPAAGRSHRSHRRSEFSSRFLSARFAATRSETKSVLSCKHATHRGCRPVPKTFSQFDQLPGRFRENALGEGSDRRRGPRAVQAQENWTVPSSYVAATMLMTTTTTLLDLVSAVSAYARSDSEVVATIVLLVNSGAVRLNGTFRGARFDLDDPAAGAARAA